MTQDAWANQFLWACFYLFPILRLASDLPPFFWWTKGAARHMHWQTITKRHMHITKLVTKNTKQNNTKIIQSLTLNKLDAKVLWFSGVVAASPLPSVLKPPKHRLHLSQLLRRSTTAPCAAAQLPHRGRRPSHHHQQRCLLPVGHGSSAMRYVTLGRWHVGQVSNRPTCQW